MNGFLTARYKLVGDITQATLIDVSLFFVFSNLMFQSYQPNPQEDTAKPYDSKPRSYVVTKKWLLKT